MEKVQNNYNRSHWPPLLHSEGKQTPAASRLAAIDHITGMIPPAPPRIKEPEKKIGPASLRLLAHLFSGGYVKNSPACEGMGWHEAVPYLIAYLEEIKQTATSKEARAVIEQTVTQFKNLSTQIKEETDPEKIRPLAKKNWEKVMNLKEGESYLMRGGWREAEISRNEKDFPTINNGHAMLYEWTRHEKEFSLRVYNTGAGTQYHPHLQSDGKEKINPCLTFQKISEKTLKPYVFEALLEPLLANSDKNPTNRIFTGCDEYIYRVCSTLSSSVSYENNLWISEQKAGTCVMSVLLAYIREKAGQELHDAIRYSLRLKALRQAWEARDPKNAFEKEVFQACAHMLLTDSVKPLFASEPKWETSKREGAILATQILDSLETERSTSFLPIAQKSDPISIPRRLYENPKKEEFRWDKRSIPLPHKRDPISSPSMLRKTLEAWEKEWDTNKELFTLKENQIQLQWDIESLPVEESFWTQVPEEDLLPCMKLIDTWFSFYFLTYKKTGDILRPSMTAVLEERTALLTLHRAQYQLSLAYEKTLKQLPPQLQLKNYWYREKPSINKTDPHACFFSPSLKKRWEDLFLYFQKKSDLPPLSLSPQQIGLLPANPKAMREALGKIPSWNFYLLWGRHLSLKHRNNPSLPSIFQDPAKYFSLAEQIALALMIGNPSPEEFSEASHIVYLHRAAIFLDIPYLYIHSYRDRISEANKSSKEETFFSKIGLQFNPEKTFFSKIRLQFNKEKTILPKIGLQFNFESYTDKIETNIYFNLPDGDIYHFKKLKNSTPFISDQICAPWMTELPEQRNYAPENKRTRSYLFEPVTHTEAEALPSFEERIQSHPKARPLYALEWAERHLELFKEKDNWVHRKNFYNFLINFFHTDLGRGLHTPLSDLCKEPLFLKRCSDFIQKGIDYFWVSPPQKSLTEALYFIEFALLLQDWTGSQEQKWLNKENIRSWIEQTLQTKNLSYDQKQSLYLFSILAGPGTSPLLWWTSWLQLDESAIHSVFYSLFREARKTAWEKHLPILLKQVEKNPDLMQKIGASIGISAKDWTELGHGKWVSKKTKAFIDLGRGISKKEGRNLRELSELPYSSIEATRKELCSSRPMQQYSSDGDTDYWIDPIWGKMEYIRRFGFLRTDSKGKRYRANDLRENIPEFSHLNDKISFWSGLKTGMLYGCLSATGEILYKAQWNGPMLNTKGHILTTGDPHLRRLMPTRNDLICWQNKQGQVENFEYKSIQSQEGKPLGFHKGADGSLRWNEHPEYRLVTEMPTHLLGGFSEYLVVEEEETKSQKILLPLKKLTKIRLAKLMKTGMKIPEDFGKKIKSLSVLQRIQNLLFGKIFYPPYEKKGNQEVKEQYVSTLMNPDPLSSQVITEVDENSLKVSYLVIDQKRSDENPSPSMHLYLMYLFLMQRQYRRALHEWKQIAVHHDRSKNEEEEVRKILGWMVQIPDESIESTALQLRAFSFLLRGPKKSKFPMSEEILQKYSQLLTSYQKNSHQCPHYLKLTPSEIEELYPPSSIDSNESRIVYTPLPKPILLKKPVGHINPDWAGSSKIYKEKTGDCEEQIFGYTNRFFSIPKSELATFFTLLYPKIKQSAEERERIHFYLQIATKEKSEMSEGDDLLYWLYRMILMRSPEDLPPYPNKAVDMHALEKFIDRKAPALVNKEPSPQFASVGKISKPPYQPIHIHPVGQEVLLPPQKPLIPPHLQSLADEIVELTSLPPPSDLVEKAKTEGAILARAYPLNRNIPFLIGLFFEGKDEAFLQLNPNWKKEDVQKIQKKIEFFLTEATQGLQGKPRAYPVSFRPALVFEYLTQMRLRPKQAKYLQAIVERGHCPVLGHLMMGEGKTHVMASLLGRMWSTRDRLALVLTPLPQWKTIRDNLAETQWRHFGQEVVSFSYSREDLSTEVLKEISHSLELAKKNQRLVVLPSEMLHILELEFIALTSTKKNSWKLWAIERALNLFSLETEISSKIRSLQKILRLLRHETSVILDEVDEVLKVDKEVNFPSGEEEDIDPEKVHKIQELFLFLFKEFPSLFDEEKEPLSQKEYTTFVLPALTQKVASFYPQQYQESLFRYLSSSLQEEDGPFITWKDTLATTSPEKGEILALYHHLLQNILPSTLTRKANRHYGRLNDSSGKVVPFVASNTPGTSEYGHVWQKIAYHFQTALSTPMTKSFFDKWASQVEKEMSIEMSLNQIPASETKVAKFYRQGLGLPIFLLFSDEDRNKIFDLFSQHPEKRLFLEDQTIFEEVKTDTRYFSSNSHNGLHFSHFFAMTGTPYNRLSYPRSLSDRPLLDQEATDNFFNRLIELNGTVYSARNLSSIDSIWRAVNPAPHVRALIDVGGCLILHKNRTYATQILEHLHPSFEGIVFFQNPSDPGGASLQFLKRGETKSIPLPNTNAATWKELGIDPKNLFFFYDQWHSRGTDFPLPADSEGLMLITKKNEKHEIAQGAGRMRKILEGQTLSYCVLEADRTLLPHIREIVAHSEEVEQERLKEQIFRHYQCELNDLIRYDHMEKLITHPHPENKIDLSLVETREEKSLYKLFGQGKKETAPLTILEDQGRFLIKKAPHLRSQIEAILEEAKAKAHLFPKTLSTNALSTNREQKRHIEVKKDTENVREIEWETDLKKESFSARNLITISETKWNKKQALSLARQKGETLSLPYQWIAPLHQILKDFPYSNPYPTLFESNLYATANWHESTPEPLPLYSPKHKPATQILMIEHGPSQKKTYSAILLSMAEAESFRTEFLKNPTTDLRMWLIDPQGHQLVPPLSPLPETKEVEELMIQINLAAGRIDWILQHEKEVTAYFGKHTTKEPLAIRFLHLHARHHGDTELSRMLFKAGVSESFSSRRHLRKGTASSL